MKNVVALHCLLKKCDFYYFIFLLLATQGESLNEKTEREMTTSESAQEAKKVLATPAVRQLAKEKGVPFLFFCFFHLATFFVIMLGFVEIFIVLKISIKMDKRQRERNTKILINN